MQYHGLKCPQVDVSGNDRYDVFQVGSGYADKAFQHKTLNEITNKFTLKIFIRPNDPMMGNPD